MTTRTCLSRIRKIITLHRHLNKNGGRADFFIARAGTSLRTSICIGRDDVGFHIYNDIADSAPTHTLTEQELLRSQIGEAMCRGAFYAY